MAAQTIRLYLGLTLITKLGISFTYATFTTFLLARGLDLFEVNIMIAIFFASIVILEIPTGMIADVFGRKYSFVCSCFLFALGMIIYAVSISFWQFALAEIIKALGFTLANGAFQAWLVDRLKYYDYPAPTLQPVFVKEQQISYGSAIIGALAGGVSADINLIFPWIAGTLTMLTAGVIAIFFMQEEYFVQKKSGFGARIDTLRTTLISGARYTFANKAMKMLIILCAVQIFAIQAPDTQWQPFFLQFVHNKTSLGLLSTAMLIAMILGSVLSSWFIKIMHQEEKALLYSQIAIGCCIAGATAVNVFPIALSIFLLHEVGMGFFRPLKDAYLNANAPSKERATLISLQSASQYLAGMLGLLISGLIAQYASINISWIFSGLIMIISSALMLQNSRIKTNP